MKIFKQIFILLLLFMTAIPSVIHAEGDYTFIGKHPKLWQRTFATIFHVSEYSFLAENQIIFLKSNDVIIKLSMISYADPKVGDEIWGDFNKTGTQNFYNSRTQENFDGEVLCKRIPTSSLPLIDEATKSTNTYISASNSNINEGNAKNKNDQKIKEQANNANKINFLDNKTGYKKYIHQKPSSEESTNTYSKEKQPPRQYKTNSFYINNLKDIIIALAILAIPLYFLIRKKPNTSSTSFIVSFFIVSFASLVLCLVSFSLLTGIASDLYTLSLTKPFYSTLFMSIIVFSIICGASYLLHKQYEKARPVMTLSLYVTVVLIIFAVFWLLKDYQSHELACLFLGLVLTLISAFCMSESEGGCCLSLCFGLLLMLISGVKVFFTYPLFSIIVILIVIALFILYRLMFFDNQDKKEGYSGVNIKNYSKDYNHVTDKDTHISNDYKYVGNKDTHIYHKIDCMYAEMMNESRKVYFASQEEAVKAGYRHCHVCKYN